MDIGHIQLGNGRIAKQNVVFYTFINNNLAYTDDIVLVTYVGKMLISFNKITHDVSHNYDEIKPNCMGFFVMTYMIYRTCCI
jgi:hypothetical protein